MTLIINFATKSKTHNEVVCNEPMTFLSQNLRGYFSLGHVQCGMLSIVTQLAIFSLETLLIITPMHVYGMEVTPTLITVHESGALPFVFVIGYGCQRIVMHCLPKPQSKVWV